MRSRRPPSGEDAHDRREEPMSAPTPSFEQGPIRPPSEAHSLLVRVIRNCAWNRCTFCPVYKGTASSLRPLEDVLADVDAMAAAAEVLRARGIAAVRDGLVPGEAYPVSYTHLTLPTNRE